MTLATIAQAARAPAAPAPASPSHPDILEVDAIRPGMKGVGKTVFHGTEIDEFDVEVIGVLKRVMPGGDVILARASGGPLAETGIMGGMSGSPVYVDGKLIGAVAFTWSFAKQPIAGITPIAEMLEVMDRAGRAPEEGTEAPPGAGAGASLGAGGSIVPAPLPEPSPDLAAARAALPASGRLLPIRTPIAVSGFDPRVLDRLLPWLEGLGFTATVGGAAPPEPPPYEALPGAAIGVQLLSGDATVTAIGTVTHREGDRILAFGHPLFQAGDVSLPMTGATIVGLLPSALSSFKIGSPLDPLGTLTQDRRPAISGTIGAPPRLVPVTVTLRSPAGTRAFRYQAVHEKALLPGLVEMATVNSLVASEAAFAEETIASRVVVRFAGGRSVVLENLHTGFSSLGEIGEEVSLPPTLLLQNRFENVRIEGVDVEATVTPGRRSGHLEAITVSKNPVRPGETVTILATVKTYQGPPRVLPISLAIPAGAEDGELTLRVCDASSLDESDTKRAPQRFEWEDLDTFLESLAERRRNDRVYAQIEAPSVGIAIAGREFPSIPRSVFAVIDSDRHTENAGVVSASVLAKGEADAGVVVTGCKTLPIRVDHTAR